MDTLDGVGYDGIEQLSSWRELTRNSSWLTSQYSSVRTKNKSNLVPVIATSRKDSEPQIHFRRSLIVSELSAVLIDPAYCAHIKSEVCPG
jgi:tRNA1(Val) A37 N6-methylase TrmN6